MKLVCAILALSILPIAACSDGAESETFIARGCDWDDDGYLAAGERCRGDDCDDDRADIGPGMTEICNFKTMTVMARSTKSLNAGFMGPKKAS